jgi:hypothetical protein
VEIKKMIKKVVSIPTTLCREKVYLFVSNVTFRQHCWYTYERGFDLWKYHSMSPATDIHQLHELDGDIIHYIRSTFKFKERYRSPYECDNVEDVKKLLLVRKLVR